MRRCNGVCRFAAASSYTEELGIITDVFSSIAKRRTIDAINDVYTLH